MLRRLGYEERIKNGRCTKRENEIGNVFHSHPHPILIHIHKDFKGDTVKCADRFSGFTCFLLLLSIKSLCVASFVTLFDDLTLIAICLYEDKAPKALKFHFLVTYCRAPHMTR